jgi:plastocyanin
MATGTYTATFTAVGSYGYHCTLHSGMSGTVTVVH